MTPGTMENMSPRFTAIVLAADRESDNPVARAAGVPCKSLASIAGVPMILRVLNALASSVNVAERILCGPPERMIDREPALRNLVTSGDVRWFENRATPSASAYHVMRSIPPETPILLTTADHALLSAVIVDDFCTAAWASGSDVIAALALHDTVARAYPQTRRTAYRLGQTAYCACNLFAFLTPRARDAVRFWHRIEDRRKNPLRVIRAFGFPAVLQYMLGGLTLTGALARVSRRLGCRADAVIMTQPEAAIDVDSISDYRLVNRIATQKGL